ncbi:biotin--[acetyl-CoA-carboxylase] ligase [Pontibacter sp. BT310]|uniref:Biotin--[acetyl-CoA-carboxylase] ligase n=1 Tax=Pontibacter populi TaxID=890055 RepID=A0ABS6X7G4_9BACT|nr:MULTISPECIES: biotin--[acetyl-CoA-carboxylase] ligase [Pontibacter]MBJ6117084.1 biotin--[acetyl-CoA-carboxylase] ligase [Pontibacter sp. BT310]MBR0569508.1 biotin--[acetyl-CoA-carboxylase] ligase [Microvirga sp. STS03]MBW3363937.1 biotin--[acetyl-CoA-carboxylase] ligase [Pontibacter populi]
MLPNTLFIGRQLYCLSVCESTNSEAQQLLIKNKATEGCTVLTSEQTKGRGQRGNNWEAEPGKNITLSVILSPVFLPVRQQFYLNMAVSLAVLDLLHEYGATDARVKWPNDLYFKDKKLGGILIENTINSHSLQHSIVGIGLNINQLNFDVNTATSLSVITGTTINLEEITTRLLELLEKRYLELRNVRHAKLKYEYLQALYRYQEVHRFIVDGKRTEGCIVGVDEDGRLGVELDGELRFFDFKEIIYII